MYLCSTLRLAWGGKFCCCQSLIDDLQLCLANCNTFFSVCNDRSSAPEADQSRDDPQKLMLLMFSLVFSRWLKHVCVTGAAVQMAPWFFLWLLGFPSCHFSHSLTYWNRGREWVARRQSMGAFFLAIWLFHYCFLLHRGSLFCFMLCVVTAWKISDFCCRCSMKYWSLWHLIHITWRLILTTKQCPSRYQQEFVHQVESHAVSGIVVLVSMFYIPVMSFLCTMLIYANKFV